MSRIKISNIDFVTPFISNKSAGVYKRRTLAHHNKKAGVYMIKENENIVYIGMSQSCVVEALYRHFYEWNDVRQYANRVTYFNKLHKHNYQVVIMVTTKQEAAKLEQSMIITLNPRDNRERYEEIVEMILKQRGYVKKETQQLVPGIPDDDLPF
jgi:heterodisulfide reductase subunit A-like polyferredoxin